MNSFFLYITSFCSHGNLGEEQSKYSEEGPKIQSDLEWRAQGISMIRPE